MPSRRNLSQRNKPLNGRTLTPSKRAKRAPKSANKSANKPEATNHKPEALKARRTQKKILAFDIATITGWCFDKYNHGYFSSKNRKDESVGFRLIRFEAKVKELIEISKPDFVVFEGIGGRHTQAIKVQSQLQGILERHLILEKIPYTAYKSTEIKKFATGKGNANKDLMISAANEWGKKVLGEKHLEITDDNEADAIHLWRLANEEFS